MMRFFKPALVFAGAVVVNRWAGRKENKSTLDRMRESLFGVKEAKTNE